MLRQMSWAHMEPSLLLGISCIVKRNMCAVSGERVPMLAF